jgi:ABC-type transport system involved in cytochrome c biogenesis ATPase subunit
MFDHTFDLNLDDRITILHGPNGYGKTTILRMISTLFSGRLSDWLTVPFVSSELMFDNGQRLQVKASPNRPKLLFKDKEPPQHRRRSLEFLLMEGNRTLHAAEVHEITAKEVDFPLGMIDDVVPELVRIGDISWKNQSTGEVYSLTEVINRYRHYLPSAGKLKIEPWLQEFTTQLKVRFIESQRLVRFGLKVARAETRWGRTEVSQSAVLFYSQRLAELIQEQLAAYAQMAQSLDQTFPMRLVEFLRTSPDAESTSKLQNRLAELESKRRRLRAVGLLEQDTAPFQIPMSLEGPPQQVLPLYVEDVERKLNTFDEILAKLELLQNIVSSRFLFKKLSIDNKAGFTFVGADGEPLAITDLSSGEQHMLVLLSELLFVIKPKSLILIDEPEISLHVAWQQLFLRDLKQVSELASLDVLIATHSPQIINDRWDLTVALEASAEQHA